MAVRQHIVNPTWVLQQEPFNDLFNGEDLPLLALKNVPSSSRKSLNATCMKRGKPGRRKTMFRLGDCKENSFTACGSAKKNGDMTVFLDQSMILDADDLDLEELTDKLSWYESVMHQLQDILGAQLDDPDADYQQESWKIVERAKRMVEYKVMIRDYEVRLLIVSELQIKTALNALNQLNRNSDFKPRKRDHHSLGTIYCYFKYIGWLGKAWFLGAQIRRNNQRKAGKSKSSGTYETLLLVRCKRAQCIWSA